MPVATEQKDNMPSAMDLSIADDLDIPSKETSVSSGFSLKKQEPQANNGSIGYKKFAAPAPVQLKQGTQTVIIFDWDDTLLASSFLSSKGYRLDSMTRSADVDAQLKMLERSITQCLTLALQYGDVHVITNAETGWVQLSAQKFLPSVVPLLDKVTILSARSTYEELYPDSPLKWKYCAFQQRLSSLFASKKVKNVISFGDSHVEREAVRAVTRGRADTKTKSVKFAERPSMEQLRRQLELVTNCFQYIYSHEGDLDLMLTISLCY